MDGTSSGMSQSSRASSCSAVRHSISGGDADINDEDLAVPLPKPLVVLRDEATLSSAKAPSIPEPKNGARVHFHYGTEHHLVGLSPHFWAHTPMLIGDILSLGLINGVDCIMSPARYENIHHTNDKAQNESSGISAGRKRRRPDPDVKSSFEIPIIDYLVPVSRCDICGFIVNMEIRANSILYLLDDGTGLIDCLAWEDDSDSLPSLVDTHARHATGCSGKIGGSTFRVGDAVRIRGKIRCVTVGGETRMIDVAPVENGVVDSAKMQRQRYEIPINVVREISVATIERMLGWQSISGLDGEIVHWLKCLQLGRRVDLVGRTGEIKNVDRPVAHEMFEEDNFRDCQELLEPIHNGAGVLSLLGKDIESRAAQMGATDLAEDDDGAWRLFGPDCSCKLLHKDILLYCHCNSTSAALDPRQAFRDVLLEYLVDMQNKEPSKPLKFQYGQLLKDETLFAAATNTVATTTNPAANARRLFVNTFRALRCDGIIYLEKEESDTYLLITRSGVLEPYLSRILDKDLSTLERSMWRLNPPPYLTRVPGNRLRFVMKNLIAKEKDEAATS